MIEKLIKINLVVTLALGAIGLVNASSSYGSEALAASSGKAKPLPLPRFVSIKSKRVNMRVGPGKQYKVDWLYQKKGLPLEIIQEYDNWRKVRDMEGSEGWILHSLLSGKRTAVINPWESDKTSGRVALRYESAESSSVVAQLEPGVVTEVLSCDESWCKVSVKNVKGYVSKNSIWGVYPDEKIED